MQAAQNQSNSTLNTMTGSGGWQTRMRLLLIVLFILSLALTTYLTYVYIDHRARLEREALGAARAQSTAATAEIDAVFGSLMVIAEGIADDLTDGTLPYTAIETRMRDEVAERPDIDGIAVTFEPYVFSEDLELFQTYIYQVDGKFEALVGATYDYSIPPTDDPDSPQTAWYHNPLNNGAMWNEPFFATGAGKVLIEYGVPFFRDDPETGEQVAAGVVTIDYSLQNMRDLMTELDLGATGYGYVTSATGTFLAYPVQELVARESVYNVAPDAVTDATRRALNEETIVSIQQEDTITGEVSWMFFEPIPTTGWIMTTVLNDAEFSAAVKRTHREQIMIVLAGAATAFFGLAIAFRANSGTTRSLWMTSTAFALLTVGVMAFTWRQSHNLPFTNGVQITDHPSLNRYIEGYTQNLSPDTPHPTLIPTGVFVQAVDFPEPTSVTINGYIWQRYPRARDSDVSRGFIMPQLIGEEYTLEEIVREEQGEDEVIVWYIGATIKQDFNPVQFPFDSRDIQLRLAPLDLSHNLILVPDLNSYNLINPRLLPGLDEEVRINNWRIQRSSYGFKLLDFNTNFGLTNRVGVTRAPELYFLVNTQRMFIGPIIAYMLPGVVAAMMLFGFLIHDRTGGEGDAFVSALNYAAALFFVIAVAHTALRDSIAAEGLTYMEYLYIMLYVAIVLIALDTYLVVKKPDKLIASYRNNLIPKLLFWPIFTGVMLLVTLVIFVFV